MTAGPYSRLYHSLVDDPMFAEVYGNDATFGTWCRLLMIADALHPASAPLPRRNSSVRSLLASGLIEERPGNRYVIRGLAAERERRSSTARNAAAVRWQGERNADPMPRRDETSKEKKSSDDANASKNGADNFMTWGGKGLHDGRHGRSCSVCAPLLAVTDPLAEGATR